MSWKMGIGRWGKWLTTWLQERVFSERDFERISRLHASSLPCIEPGLTDSPALTPTEHTAGTDPVWPPVSQSIAPTPALQLRRTTCTTVIHAVTVSFIRLDNLLTKRKWSIFSDC